MRAAWALVLLAACGAPLESPFRDAGLPACGSLTDGSPACGVPAIIDNQPILDPNDPDNTDVQRGADGTSVIDAQICGANHRLSLQLYPGHGILAGGIVGDTFDLSAESEHSFASCGVCLLLYTDLDPHGDPTRTYMASGGTLVVQSFGAIGGAKFLASLGNVTFREVKIDPIDFSTTVTSGCSTAIPSMVLRGPVRSLD
jgi:hypothetical protein